MVLLATRRVGLRYLPYFRAGLATLNDPGSLFLPQSPDPSDDQNAKNPNLRDRILESALTTFASLTTLALVGYGYHKYYKHLVLQKIENAFAPGDPALQLHHNRHRQLNNAEEGQEGAADFQFVLRDEQQKIDEIIQGKEQGRYYLIIGEKGNGKKGMLLNAMHSVNGKYCAVVDAHSDLEIFRIRLGKALDYEFAEDFIGGLFSIKGQRDAGPILDIERAFNKLEKVALRHRRRKGSNHKPLIMIFNNMHLIRDDDDGNKLLELLQQKAESFASSGLMTFVFNTDDYWLFERLKQNARRMELLPVTDLPKSQAMRAFSKYRCILHGVGPSEQEMDQVWNLVGGRLSYLSKVAKARHMIRKAQELKDQEKTWLLNQCALIPDFDDDVLDDGKWYAGAFTMAQALVEEEKRLPVSETLPTIPLYRCRQILTRADFMQKLDQLNIITIVRLIGRIRKNSCNQDSNANVRPDSRAMMNAFREIVAEDDFQDNLDNVKDRCDAIESLHRTRELVWKEANDVTKAGVIKLVR